MLEESGLLHEEPLKILSSVESAQAKTQRSKSLPSRGRTNNFPVKRTHFSKGSKSLTDRVATSSSASSGQTQLNMKRSSQAIEVCNIYSSIINIIQKLGLSIQNKLTL